MPLDNPAQILPSVTAVNDDWKFKISGDFQLPNENAFLHVSRRVVVMVIQTDLTQGDDLGILRSLGKTVKMGGFRALRFVGVDADRSVDPIELVGKRYRGGKVIRPPTSADGKQVFQSCRAGALDHSIAVAVELWIIEMRVGIKKELIHESII